MNEEVVAQAVVPGQRPVLSDAVLVLLLMGAVLAPRLVVLGVNENYFGDAVSRADLAARWADRPHVIGSFDQGAYQFGPLHIVLLGVLNLLGGSREHSGRWLSLLASLLTVLPLFALTRRMFGRSAAIAACLGLAAWGMHVQFSTTAASEALSVLWVLTTVALFARALQTDHRPSLLGAALALNLACATRYDVWLYVPLLTGVLVVGRRRQWAALFFGLAVAFPLAWCHGNWVDRGDPFFPLRYIDDYHRRWFKEGEHLWGPVAYRLQNLGFWPAVAVFTLSPLVGAAGIWGLVRAWRERRDLRWLVALVVIPTALFTFRSTLSGSFVPVARFAAKEVALLLPFAWFGFEAIRPAVWRGRVLIAAAAIAVAMPIWLGFFTLHREGRWPDSLRPVSPVSTNSVELMRVARFLGHQDGAILDEDPQYRDLQLAFFSGLPEDNLARLRWPIYPQRLESAQPRYLVRIEGGRLEQLSPVDGQTLRFNGWTFTELEGFSPPFHVYRR